MLLLPRLATCLSSRAENRQVPSWLELDIEKLQGSVLNIPTRDQIDMDIQEQLIVELYSK